MHSLPYRDQYTCRAEEEHLEDDVGGSNDLSIVEEPYKNNSHQQQQQQQQQEQQQQKQTVTVNRYNSYNSIGSSNSSVVNSTARIVNGRLTNGNIIHNSNNASSSGNSNNNSVLVTYTNNNNNNSQDLEVIDQDCMDSGQFSANSSQSLSRNSSFGSGNVAVLTSQNFIQHNNNVNNSYQPQQQQMIHTQQQNGTNHHPQQQQQHILVQQQPQHQQIEYITSNSGTNNQQISHGNMSNVTSIVSHPQIIGSMKNNIRMHSGGLLPNGSGNQPVLLIYNATGTDEQLTLNGRKILLPKPLLDGQMQPNLIKSNSGTLLSIATSNGSNNNYANSLGDQVDDSVNGVIHTDMKSIGDGNNMSISIVKRDSPDHEDSGAINNAKQQFRHIPISAVAQNPSRDQRKNLCVAKKMPRLKPIPGKVVATPGVTVSMGGGNVGGQHQVIVPTQSIGHNQLLLTRTSSSHQIIVPLNQSQSMDMREMSSPYPNMSVVKREPHDDGEEDDDKEDEELVNVISKQGGNRNSRLVYTSVAGNVRQNYSSNDSRGNYDSDGERNHTDNIKRKRIRQTYSDGKRSNHYSDSATSVINNRQSYDNGRSEGHTRQYRISEGGNECGPDSAEMLAAQVLASSLGSRQIAVSAANSSS